jgi:HAD superfamily hydrolase (TIGR01484 family)
MKSPTVLTTDLDGTWLHGDEVDRQKMYDEFEQIRETQNVPLIYVTGRELAFVKGLIQGVSQGSGKSQETPYSTKLKIPVPDLVIHNIGCGMYSPHNQYKEQIYQYNQLVQSRWNTPGDVENVKKEIAQLNQKFKGKVKIYPQSGKNMIIHRLAYFIEGKVEEAKDSIVASIKAHRFDANISSDSIYDRWYLDVLPQGINKGTALRSALDWIPHDKLLFAGDSLNDDSVFQSMSKSNGNMTGTAVVVGNASNELKRKYPKDANIKISQKEGVSAVMEALYDVLK